MEWRNLSDEAQSIIEWVVNPLDNVNILITEELYKEISKYVTQSEDMEYEQSDKKLVFRLKDGVEI